MGPVRGISSPRICAPLPFRVQTLTLRGMTIAETGSYVRMLLRILWAEICWPEPDYGARSE